ncbi:MULTISPECIES: NAD(P)/FAD-dependent oxidoreductase [unclassified Nocardioides]|uniref:NAD(P)/FAD-dependent oxidoreductase n=1 Tax=unclassified Nocardioides TaxID=2615069 RepID=UPI0009E6C89C|nr:MULTISPECIES: NAD(P)/FAD-dependent oxidoreductase [unclassified Nocardioides]
MTQTSQPRHYDVAVIGAGSAGLQAALTLGRMRRDVVVFSTDRFRNDPAEHMQNFLGHDGESPAELRLAARKDLERYGTVELVERAVVAVEGAPDAFVVAVDGSPDVTARRVLLATGLSDELPDVPGLADLFGTVVAHCPYCHGHELADRRVGLLGAGPHVPMLAQLISRLASEVVVLTNGAEPEPAVLAAIKALRLELHTGPVLGVEAAGDGLRALLGQDHAVELGGMFVAPTWRQAAPFAEQLGLETGELGGVLVDIMGATSRPGVYAAGDLAHHRDLPMPMASVLTAAAAGLVAGAACDRDLAMADLARVVTMT